MSHVSFRMQRPALRHTVSIAMAKRDNQFCLNPRVRKERKVPSNGLLPAPRPRKRAGDVTAGSVAPGNEQWYSALTPTVLSDLAVHPAKQKEVTAWFNGMSGICDVSAAMAQPDDRPSRMTLIQGPSGSGKSTAVTLIAQSLGFEIMEYVSDESSAHELHAEDQKHGFNGHQSFAPSHTAKFDSFLRNCCRYNSESRVSDRKVILVEELPHVFLMRPTSFHKLLKQFVSVFPRHVPIIFTWTTSINNSDSLKLFPKLFCESLNITTINFNSVSDTMLRKALKRLKVYSEMTEDEVRAVLDASAGDLRSAFNEVELRFTKRQQRIFLAGSTSRVTCKKAKVDCASDKWSHRQLFKSNFNFVGKVLYPKRLVSGELMHPIDETTKRQFPLVTDADVLVRERPCSSGSLLMKLHHSYFKRTWRLEEVSRCCDFLSEAEMISRADFREEKPHFQDYLAELIIRSVMYTLPPKLVDAEDRELVAAPPGFVTQDSPKFYEIDNLCRRIRKIALDTSACGIDYRSSDLFCDILPFVPFMSPAQKKGNPLLVAIAAEMGSETDGTSQRTQYSEQDDIFDDEDGDKEEEPNDRRSQEKWGSVSDLSHANQSNCVKQVTEDWNGTPVDPVAERWTQLSQAIKGLGVDEDPADYSID